MIISEYKNETQTSWLSQKNYELEQKVSEGLDRILSLLDEPIWPRTISTKTTMGRQIRINSTQEALAWYEAANFLDCRISAYPYNDKIGGKRIDLVMVDLDLSNFTSKEQLDLILKRTRNKIEDTFGRDLEPLILWSGNGYHVYIPIESRYILEETTIFGRFDEPSKLFLRFAEWYLSNGKADPKHFTNVSLQNCMLRIPGSYNSKLIAQINNAINTSAEVRLITLWNEKRAQIYSILDCFLAYLHDQKYKVQKPEINPKNGRQIDYHENNDRILWIESAILQNPLYDHRKYVIWRILSPYLINIRMLSTEESYSIIEDWLAGCNNLKKLNFNAKTKIREGLKGASKGFRPIRLDRLATDNKELYRIIMGTLNKNNWKYNWS
ncbi:MAG: DNA primase noncatalytic subunit PriX [Nitrososphaeraceae archaeon]